MMNNIGVSDEEIVFLSMSLEDVKAEVYVNFGSYIAGQEN